MEFVDMLMSVAPKPSSIPNFFRSMVRTLLELQAKAKSNI